MMRVTNEMITNNSIAHMSDSLAKLYQLQTKAATGKDFLKASENPAKAVKNISLRSSQEALKSFMNTANVVDNWLSDTEFNLQELTDLGTRVKTLIVRGMNDSLDADSRNDIANELNSILDEAVSIANAKHQDSYLFAGANTTNPVPPFSRDTSGATETVVYQASVPVSLMRRDIAPGETITMNVDGNEYFINSDFFDSIIAARDALAINDTTALASAQTRVDDAANKLMESLTTVGVRLNSLETSIERMDQSNIDMQSFISQNQEVNLAEVYSQISNQEMVYRSVLQVSSRANSLLNLFEVL
jgi:flagellar hook-associated protein 3 FlgL